MSIALGQKLKIRSMIYVAAEPVPYFWPMREFIHHNPLHGLEDMPFEVAVKTGSRLFHGRVFLPRTGYQDYLQHGKLSREALQAEVVRYLEGQERLDGIDLSELLMQLLTRLERPVMLPTTLLDDADIHAAFHNRPLEADGLPSNEVVAERLQSELLGDRPLYETVDALCGTDIAEALDELVIKSCLDFFDEGQSVWGMPNREQGFFAAWRQVALRNLRLPLRGLHIGRILEADDSAEGIIDYVMKALDIPEQDWMAYFTRELARLHGWAGFIRWRSNAKHYYWAQKYPADLVDYMAVRLTLALALLSERGHRNLPYSSDALAAMIRSRTQEAYLRHEFYGGTVLPAMAHRVESSLLLGKGRKIEKTYQDYVVKKRRQEAMHQAQALRELEARAGIAFGGLSESQFGDLLAALRKFERAEGMIWLQAMESQAIDQLMQGISLEGPAAREKRPFAQALFCIDTRSERIRRQLEGMGDYQTFGIAGFFGVPVSFMELGKGSETHLCPVLLTPKNVVMEMSMDNLQPQALGALEKALHSLKESVLTPFVTVEAIGLLFGFDMVGKTVAPRIYNRWRHRMHPQKPVTRLLLDKLSREQGDSIVRAVQRAVIVKAMELELGLSTERLTDELVRDLREAAMDHEA
ncbi:MAG: DUF2309 family protein, partial [Gammaproteobacteria bacterium]|nr:DUF2309 family protein [Gammaproteobacteria bacterium]